MPPKVNQAEELTYYPINIAPVVIFIARIYVIITLLDIKNMGVVTIGRPTFRRPTFDLL